MTALLSAALFVAGCASTGPVYDVPVTEPAPEVGGSAPSIDPEVTQRPKPQSAATTTLLAASETARAEGDYRLAISHIERAIRLEPKRSDLWTALALAHLDDGKSARARQYAQKALALAGNRGDLKRAAWLAMADIEAAEGNLAEARRIRRQYRSSRG